MEGDFASPVRLGKSSSTEHWTQAGNIPEFGMKLYNPAMTTVREYLEGLAEDCPVPPGGDLNFWHYVLANGVDFRPCATPADWIVERGKAGNCFKNALLLVLRHLGELRYAEGYAAYSAGGENRVCPGLHAWAVTRDGQAVDPTWPNGVEYFGVAFALDQVTAAAKRNREFAGVISDVKGGWPLLKRARP